MPDYQSLLDWMQRTPAFTQWADTLPAQINQGMSIERWGDLPQWQEVLDCLPSITPSALEFTSEVRIGSAADCSDEVRAELAQTLMGLHPWRKGPFHLFGLHLDTEWHSDWKWDRLLPHLPSLTGQHILDVGCGNGYHCLRLFGAGAARVIGIDPSPRFIHQFYALKHYCPDVPVDVLPLGIEHVPANLHSFDTVLSMGVIYHRRDPLAHIRELMACLKPGGLLVLETLIVDEAYGPMLVPEGRYAKMRNLWCIPSPTTVLAWFEECGLKNARLVDRCVTSTDEQRKTPWMTFESLEDFLDPTNPALTVEGYPAPQRGIFLAEV